MPHFDPIASLAKKPANAENPEASPPIIPLNSKTIIQLFGFSGRFNIVPTRLANMFSFGIV